jgi:hypothetical protein
MLYVDIPTVPEFRALASTRADACVSIYLPTTPVTQDTAASRIELKNLTKSALAQLTVVGVRQAPPGRHRGAAHRSRSRR